jgi:hypothetical protein
MKKIFFAIVTLCVVWAGTQTMLMNSASAQMSAFTGTVTPLTNQIGFTNTLVPAATNPAALQLDDVVALLLSLQTNVEQTLPSLTLIVSNATFVNISAAAQFPGAFAPITSNPPSLFSPPATPGAPQPASFSLTVGTNTFPIDPPTLQALIQLRDDLERALPVLQALNGTTASPTNINNTTTPFLNPPVTSFLPAPITNGFSTPLTNQTLLLSPNVSSAF